MSRKAKIILSLITLLVIVGGLIVGVFLVRRSQEIRRKAAPATTLSIQPSTQAKLPGQTFNFSVRMNTGENQVTALDVDLSYDPSALEVTSIERGSGISNFQEITNNIDNAAGKIAYSAYTSDKNKAVEGSVNLINVSGKMKTDVVAGVYAISFASTTTVAGVGEGQNVLTGTTPGSITVSAETPSPTPTPTPTSTPTPSPTPGGVGGDSIPTSTPTLTPTPTPTPTGIGGGSTTPTPTPPPIPESGVSFPTILGLGIGILLLIGSFVLVL